MTMKCPQPLKTFGSHAILLLCASFLALPLYMAIVAASHDMQTMMHLPLPYLPGKSLLTNIYSIWDSDLLSEGGASLTRLLWNSLWMALGIALGKILIALMASFSLVYISFPFKRLFFSMILMTFMLPIEVRLVPTFEIVASFHGLNTLWGLSLPLMVSATAVLLFRQVLVSLPPHLVDAARLDGAGPIRFFWDILLPAAKAPMCSLFVILFIYGWNQYLWPLVLTTQPRAATIVMGMRYLSGAADLVPQWNTIMSIALIALLPPCLVLLIMQRSFEQGIR